MTPDDNLYKNDGLNDVMEHCKKLLGSGNNVVVGGNRLNLSDEAKSLIIKYFKNKHINKV